MMTEKPEFEQEITKQLIGVINSQAKLIDKLLENQRHLIEQIKAVSSNDTSSFSSSAVNKEHLHWNNFPSNNPSRRLDVKCSAIKSKSLLKTQDFNKFSERDQFSSQLSEEALKVQSDQSDQSEYKQAKIPQTKNVIKNFSKSLFRFMQKHRVYVNRVLDHLEIKEEDFQNVFQKFRGRIYTIVDLKRLWLDDSNEFGQAFRIISLEYLRKNSLNHIFNSRVKNHKTHIKYRKKMQEILQNPSEFNSIKYG